MAELVKVLKDMVGRVVRFGSFIKGSFYHYLR